MSMDDREKAIIAKISGNLSMPYRFLLPGCPHMPHNEALCQACLREGFHELIQYIVEEVLKALKTPT